MRLVSVIAIGLLASCTFTGSVCKTDAGASAGCTLEGTWASGKNTITFAADGTYTAMLDGNADTGTWSLSGLLGCGATMTFSDAACGTIRGTYGLSIEPFKDAGGGCTTLSLSGQGDDCGTRANELSNTQYKRQ